MVIQPFPRIMLVLALLFLGTTLWSVSVTGFFEPPRIDVEHFAAGAGNNLLIIRFFTALALAIGGVAWALGTAPMAIRSSRAAIAPLVLVLFGWSVVALDRFAPGYSEAAFLNIVERHQRGEQFTTTNVQRLLGEPLVKTNGSSLSSAQRVLRSGATDNQSVWSYSYTPSGGFGWPKRILVFDTGGQLVDAYRLDEP